MTLFEYYNILGISSNATVGEIKKAYRSKARQYHPDINHASDAKDHFISITEAYEFLIAYQAKINSDEQAYNEAIDDWRKYRQTKAQRRANAYARTSYASFKNTSFYKTTRIFDGTTIIYGFIISVTVIICTIIGYFYRLKHPLPGLEKPSVFTFIMLLLVGAGFFVITYAYLISYLADSKKRKKKSSYTA